MKLHTLTEDIRTITESGERKTHNPFTSTDVSSSVLLVRSKPPKDKRERMKFHHCWRGMRERAERKESKPSH